MVLTESNQADFACDGVPAVLEGQSQGVLGQLGAAYRLQDGEAGGFQYSRHLRASQSLTLTCYATPHKSIIFTMQPRRLLSGEYERQESQASPAPGHGHGRALRNTCSSPFLGLSQSGRPKDCRERRRATPHSSFHCPCASRLHPTLCLISAMTRQLLSSLSVISRRATKFTGPYALLAIGQRRKLSFYNADVAGLTEEQAEV